MITLLYLTVESDATVPTRALRGADFSRGPRGTSGGRSIYLDKYRHKSGNEGKK